MSGRTPETGPGVSPYETAASATTRFLVELTAWVAGPWAAADVTGRAWVAIPAGLLLVGLPAGFNVPGDKNGDPGVAIPGPVRIVIEAVLMVIAVAGAWIVWPAWLAILVTAIAAAMPPSGLARYRWLASGAPPVGTPEG